MYRRRALIIGIAGQDGSLLAELLLAEGYEVFGVVRQPASTRFENLEPVRDRLELMQADVLHELSLVDVLSSCRPHEVYNLASPSFVPMSWRQPVLPQDSTDWRRSGRGPVRARPQPPTSRSVRRRAAAPPFQARAAVRRL